MTAVIDASMTHACDDDAIRYAIRRIITIRMMEDEEEEEDIEAVSEDWADELEQNTASTDDDNAKS